MEWMGVAMVRSGGDGWRAVGSCGRKLLRFGLFGKKPLKSVD
jgi:hypothetical protein